jgi:polysaccharide biosynthesis/export protein
MSQSAPFSRTARLRTASLALAVALAGVGVAAATPTATSLPPPDAINLATQTEYVIGPLDRISITVFQVPDLSLKDVQVDTTGRISMPLVGDVLAAGKTANQLGKDLADRLGSGYLQSPQVSVTVEESANQKITVEGAVVQPGVFQITGPTTLLQTIAMAHGPDKTADIRHVGVFRTIQGQRAAAVFDLKAIRSGDAPDPAIYANDMVVVQGSGVRGAWQEVLRSAPLIGIFRFLF